MLGSGDFKEERSTDSSVALCLLMLKNLLVRNTKGYLHDERILITELRWAATVLYTVVGVHWSRGGAVWHTQASTKIKYLIFEVLHKIFFYILALS